MEIYNEVINDLLDKSSTNLKIREESNTPIGAYVQGLKAHKLVDYDHFLEILAKGESNRHYGKTDMNQKYSDVYSSRSHSLFRIVCILVL